MATKAKTTPKNNPSNLVKVFGDDICSNLKDFLQGTDGVPKYQGWYTVKGLPGILLQFTEAIVSDSLSLKARVVSYLHGGVFPTVAGTVALGVSGVIPSILLAISVESILPSAEVVLDFETWLDAVEGGEGTMLLTQVSPGMYFEPLQNPDPRGLPIGTVFRSLRKNTAEWLFRVEGYLTSDNGENIIVNMLSKQPKESPKTSNPVPMFSYNASTFSVPGVHIEVFPLSTWQEHFEVERK